MVLYTPLAWEDIFPADTHYEECREQWVQGRLCLVRRGRDGMVRLERLLSTEVNDYWMDEFQPMRLLD